ncbi:MAG: MFS transporter [Planctomycetota bacterium]
MACAEDATPRWFPGWTMVAVAAGAFFVSAPGQSYSVAAFKEPMKASLQMSDTGFSLLYTVATLLSGAMLPVVGRLLDTHGASRVLPALTALLGAACLVMAGVQSWVAFGVALCCVRSLGQGAMTLAGNWLIGEWFERRRGFATAIAGLGGGASVVCVPLANDWVIGVCGWRGGWVALATLVWGVMLLPSRFLVCDRPELMGLSPDGDRPIGVPATGAADPESGPIPASRVIGVVAERRFWSLLAPVATTAMVVTGLVFHSVAILGDRGVGTRSALGLVSAQAIAALFLTPLAGWLTDRLRAYRVLAVSMALLAAAPLLLFAAPHPAALAAYTIALGVAEAANRTAGVTVWLECYGRRNQGAIRGVAMAGVVAGAAAGPLPIALARDQLATAAPALIGFSVVASAAGAAVAAAGAGPSRADR